MKYFFAVLLLAIRSCVAQPGPNVEVYGPVSASQVYDSLGINISGSNEWEYQAAQAAHITWGRFDCSWQSVERQRLPDNTSLGYSLPQNCVSGLAYGREYGVHIIIDALYGAPYGKVATAITTADSPVGSTVIPISVISGSFASVQPGQSYLKFGSTDISSRHAYGGTLISSKTATSVTLASKLTTDLPMGARVALNLQLYPPVLISPGENFTANSSVRAYGNYVHFLQTQVASSGYPGRVSIWNEPPWGGDPWDDAANLYDVPPAQSRPGAELASYAATLPTISAAPLDNGYTNKSGSGSLFAPNRRSGPVSSNSIFENFVSESFHPYGNNPEDKAWLPDCVKARNTSQAYGKVFQDCTPVGMITGANIKWVAAFNAPEAGFRTLPLGITETGMCRCKNPDVREDQISRFDLRQFLVYSGADVHPILFYRLAGDHSYEWLRPDHSPYPVYQAFAHLMKDMSGIAHAPISAPSPAALPRVNSYAGTYPLAMVILVGSRPGDRSNSFAIYTWQRSYTAGKWAALASPPDAPLSLLIPSDLQVASVVDTVTLNPVNHTVREHVLTYPVTDDPVEVMLIPGLR